MLAAGAFTAAFTLLSAFLALAMARRRIRLLLAAQRLREKRHMELLAAVREATAAAARSIVAVRARVAALVRRLEPAFDAVAIFDLDGFEARCSHTDGSRFEHFSGCSLHPSTEPSPIAEALASGRAIEVRGGGNSLVPTDRFAVAFPLAGGRRPQAVVYAASRQPVSPPGLEAVTVFLENVETLYALALEREADRRRANFDGLTGLLTPRALRKRLASECERALTREPCTFSLLFVDTDNFKGWNDRFGHAAGDGVLRRIAELLAQPAGPDRIAARNGGDEFCLLLLGVAKSGAIAEAERLRRNVAREPFSAALRRPQTAAPITTSIGVAAFPSDASSPNALLEMADTAMYAAKAAGRNCVAYFDALGTLRVRSDGRDREAVGGLSANDHSPPEVRYGPESRDALA